MTTASLLDEALDAWDDARRGLIAELQRVPVRRIDFRPDAGARSVAELVLHLIDTGLMWSGELSDASGDFTRKSFPAFIREYGTPPSRRPRTKAALVRLLRSSHAKGVRQIRGLGEVGMLQTVRRFDGETWTRLAWMNHGIAHEDYHRGQLALYVRLLGRTPALTKRIEGGS